MQHQKVFETTLKSGLKASLLYTFMSRVGISKLRNAFWDSPLSSSMAVA